MPAFLTNGIHVQNFYYSQKVISFYVKWPLRGLQRWHQQMKDVGFNSKAVLLNRMWKYNEPSRVQKWVTKWREWKSEHRLFQIRTQFHNVPVTVNTEMTYSAPFDECLSIISSRTKGQQLKQMNYLRAKKQSNKQYIWPNYIVIILSEKYV